MSDLTLSPDEIHALTGYQQSTKQLRVLHDRGFTRAYINRGGVVVLERSHYEAIRECLANPRPMAVDRPDLPPLVHWTRRPEHLERVLADREAMRVLQLEQKARDDDCRQRALAYAAEQAKTRPQRRGAIVRFHAAKRRTAKLRRTPSWADMARILEFHREAALLTEQTGIPHHVDHVIPLQGRLVSGLHVPENMQILTARENSKKRNHFGAGHE